jgi:hypothetical protein
MTKALALLTIMALALAGCDEIVAGPYAAPVLAPPALVPAAMQPGNPALSRLYFFRDYDASGTMQWTSVFLNGKPVGTLGQGGYFYRDVTPGTYTITVRSEGIHSDQFATATVPRHGTVFVQVYSIDFYAAQSISSPFSYNGPATFADDVVAPKLAMARMAKLHPQE